MSKSVKRRKAIMAGLKVVKVPKIKNDNPFQDANELLSSFPRAQHESREPTEKETKRRSNGWHSKLRVKKK